MFDWTKIKNIVLTFFFITDTFVALQERRGRPVEARTTHSDESDVSAASRARIREILFHVDGK